MPLRVADPSLWFALPGVAAAYQMVGAPGAIFARSNIARGGDPRLAASEVGSPSWSSMGGTAFNGGSSAYQLPFTPTAECSVLIRFSNCSAGYVMGEYQYNAAFLLYPDLGGASVRYWSGDTIQAIAPAMTAGVLGMAGRYGFRVGVKETPALGAYTGVGPDSILRIGGYYSTADGGAFTAVTVQAFALYARTLTDSEMWLASQQIAHCDTVADYSVWTPQRRWFFITSPPPAAATPVLSTIYINSADIGDTSLFDDVSGAAVSASYARTGTNSFKLDGSDYLQADLTSSATKHTKFGLLVTDTPPSDALLCAWQETGTEHVSLYLTDKLTLQMRQGSTIIQTSPTTLEVNTWYCIETKIVVHTTTGRFQVRIDGVDDMTAIGINTDDDVGGVINEIRFESPVDDTYIDDIVVREDQWCGTGGVYVVVPTAAGTVEEWTGTYTSVDDLPPSFADYITATAETGVDQVFRHGELAGDHDVGVVGVFAKGRLDSAAADIVFNALARIGTTDHSGTGQDLDTIGVYARVLMTTNPDGSVAWTTHAVNNALQIGVRT